MKIHKRGLFPPALADIAVVSDRLKRYPLPWLVQRIVGPNLARWLLSDYINHSETP